MTHDLAHPVADLFPMMSDEELHLLAEDIRVNGLQEPIWRHRDGRIIDGRNRFKACAIAGVDCKALTYERPDETIPAFVGSHNLHRRHLTNSQRSAIGAELATMKLGANQFTEGRSIDRPSVSEAQAAEIMGVSQVQVRRMKRVKREAPEAFEQVKAGKMTVRSAMKEIGADPNVRKNAMPTAEDKSKKKRKRPAIPPALDLNQVDLQIGRDLQDFLCRIPFDVHTPEEAANLRDPRMSAAVDRYFAERIQWVERWAELWRRRRQNENGGPAQPAAHLN